jgi:DNA repair protein RecN (Recombination protein N)
MLLELFVRDLGVIEEVRVELGAGLTALSGETGAGKTLLVEALDLLLGGRADAVLVRSGAKEAIVEGRFVTGDEEVILRRAVPAGGRSRAWIDGSMAPVSALSELGLRLVDIDGQQAHHSLLDPAAQRDALDAFGAIDLRALTSARARRAGLVSELEELGGDTRAREREADLLRYQLQEITSAAITGPEEDALLAAEEDRLARAAAHREAAASALRALDPDRSGPGSGAVDLLGEARAALEGRKPLGTLAERLAAAQAEAADLASELHRVLDTWEDDPEHLAQVQARRQLLRELSRKYGEGPGGILAYAADAKERIEVIDSTAERAAALNLKLAEADVAVAQAEAALGAARRREAPLLAAEVERRLRGLAMPRALVEILVGEQDPGDAVVFELGANPGEPVLPLSKVASGGELARAMLALRLVLSDAPPTMVFDEVDAGIGGEAGTAVGAALAEVARDHQVLVVTHLAQVAAFASRQLGVTKEVWRGRSVARVRELAGEERVVELARMLSGQPGSATARRHAQELLRAGTRSGAA